MNVVFIRSDGRRKVGMHHKMTEKKAKEMIDKGIVKEYNGPWPPQKTKMKFNLKSLKKCQ